MHGRLRDTLVTVGAGVCLAGPIAAMALPLAPPAWRRPALVWGILVCALALTASLRRRRS
jgi:hypothetical protein